MQILRETGLLKALVFIIYCLKLITAQCPPSKKQLEPIIADLKVWWEPLKKLKPGTSNKDADFVIYRVVKEFFTAKKYGPCNEGIDWNDIEKEAILSRKECYRPQDFSKESVQKEFKECMQKLIPPMIVKYTASSLEACDCFGSKILPNYQTKYKKMIKSYFDEFKTLKHRKGK